ncbi:MAG TPA: MBL fold metallo-hydrolase [Longimicrobiaceae bacterium]
MMRGLPRHRSVAGFPELRVLRAASRSPMTLDGTRTFVLGTQRPLVIDPGPRDEEHLETLLRLLDGFTPGAILLTHGHADHAGGAPLLAERTGAPIAMGRGALRLPFPVERVTTWLTNGDVLDSDAGPVRVISTPGHAPEHLVFLYVAPDGRRALFAGDLLLGVGDSTVVSHPEGSVSDYLRSLETVTEARPTVIFPAHGPPLRDPERAIARYRSHRLARIEQVRRLRSERPELGAEAMIELVYGPELDPRLLGAARGSIEAILAHLDADNAH